MCLPRRMYARVQGDSDVIDSFEVKILFPLTSSLMLW